ncbi:hypothetical protein GCM10009765_60090 [Fodinicola feengrottensis]|uniref:Uncharacterized protein n=1 Tax=Fodinicola feengrottensis TaxID=435914 RepID=A0ABN2ID80_9ACTN
MAQANGQWVIQSVAIVPLGFLVTTGLWILTWAHILPVVFGLSDGWMFAASAVLTLAWTTAMYWAYVHARRDASGFWLLIPINICLLLALVGVIWAGQWWWIFAVVGTAIVGNLTAVAAAGAALSVRRAREWVESEAAQTGTEPVTVPRVWVSPPRDAAITAASFWVVTIVTLIVLYSYAITLHGIAPDGPSGAYYAAAIGAAIIGPQAYIIVLHASVVARTTQQSAKAKWITATYQPAGHLVTAAIGGVTVLLLTQHQWGPAIVGAALIVVWSMAAPATRTIAGEDDIQEASGSEAPDHPSDRDTRNTANSNADDSQRGDHASQDASGVTATVPVPASVQLTGSGPTGSQFDPDAVQQARAMWAHYDAGEGETASAILHDLSQRYPESAVDDLLAYVRSTP